MENKKIEEYIKAEIAWWNTYCTLGLILGAINNGRSTIREIQKARIQAQQAQKAAETMFEALRNEK